MPVKDYYHDVVARALIKDGWTITDEQVKVIVDERNLYIDLEATKDSTGLIILVEVKELDDVDSPVEALANAVGKYFLYRTSLDNKEIAIPLYLAVSVADYQGILSETIGKLAVTQGNILLLIFDPEQEEVVRWIP
ncbi:MAG: fatty-acid synthase [Chloroflexi bacterium]|nr:fatty-acid synthase [Chloroflexota bacterium]